MKRCNWPECEAQTAGDYCTAHEREGRRFESLMKRHPEYGPEWLRPIAEAVSDQERRAIQRRARAANVRLFAQLVGVLIVAAAMMWTLTQTRRAEVAIRRVEAIKPRVLHGELAAGDRALLDALRAERAAQAKMLRDADRGKLPALGGMGVVK